MKESVKYFMNMTACAVGWLAGCWLWQEVLEDKVENLKEKLANRGKEEA